MDCRRLAYVQIEIIHFYWLAMDKIVLQMAPKNIKYILNDFY